MLSRVIAALQGKKNNHGDNSNMFRCLYIKDFVEVNLLSDVDEQVISKCELSPHTALCSLPFIFPRVN